MNKTIKFFKILNVVGLIAVIATNILANTLPINNMTTGEVSAQYDNFFTPAGFTFSIWSVIYIGLIAFAIFQFFDDKKHQEQSNTVVLALGTTFFISCFANVSWIFAWHYQEFSLTILFMALLLLSLIDINRRLFKLEATKDFSKSFKAMVWAPFGIYLGWICIATIANVAVYLTFKDWSGFGISELSWTIAMLVIGTLIGLWLLARTGLIPAAMAIMWGIIGIYFKQWQNNGSDTILITSLILIGLLAIGVARTFRRKKSAAF
jgi:hypothetical protein